MAKNSLHVIPSPDGGWVVKKGDASRASKIFKTQEDAIDWEKAAGKSVCGEVIIHRRDGTIRSRDSYGNDPHPPRDSK